MTLGILAVGLAVGPAACAVDVTAICQSAGGTYADGTCSRWGPGHQAAAEACEASGGVYLSGQDRCEFGMGGP